MVGLREIVLDTESTGLDYKLGDRIIEIACIELIDKIKTNNYFHTYLNTNKTISKGANNIHGISNKFLKDKPYFCDIADNFYAFIKDTRLVIHNAKFDIGFINNEFQLFGMKKLSMANVTDTLCMARKMFPGSPASLDALCRRFNINLNKRDKHNALIDAELLTMVYIQLTSGKQVELTFKSQRIANNYSKNIGYKLKERTFTLSKNENDAHKKMLKSIPHPLWNNYD